jgi:hypothetical protein
MTLGKSVIFLLLISALLTIPCILHAGDIKPQRVEAFRYKDTIITSYLIRRITTGKNMIYSSAFQMAWDKLTNNVIRELVALEGKPIAVQMLNRRLTASEDISENNYLAMAGYAMDNIVEKTKQALQEKFNDAPGVDIELKRPHDILLYSYLFKEIKFDPDFEVLENPMMFNGKDPVKAFGIKEFILDESHLRLGEHVEVLDYKSDNEFIIRLKSSSFTDEVILAMVPLEKTLAATVDSVFVKVAASRPSPLKEKDTLQMPGIDFDVVDWFIELEGRKLLNRGMEDFAIAKAIESIRFKFDAQGAVLEMQPAVSEIQMRKPRRLIFNRPFLLYLTEQRADYPYLVIWVDNAEILL